MKPYLKKINKNGFTLIEILAVIAIIGILETIAVPNFIAYRQQSICVAAEEDAYSLCLAVYSYFHLQPTIR